MALYTNLIEDSREKLKKRLDEYCLFNWGGNDSFETWGAFIISSSREDLRFHTGPAATASYSKPQFGQYGNLLGVEYDTMQVSFKIGLYYITENDWRTFLEDFDPLKVEWLYFGFEKDWKYHCRCSKIADTSRRVLKKTDDGTLYYAETTLTFDIIGEPVAYRTKELEWTPSEETEANSWTMEEKDNLGQLDFPLDITWNFDLTKIKSEKLILTATVKDEESENSEIITLFNVTLNNLSWSDDSKSSYGILHLRYLSDAGILLYAYGSSQQKILSYQQTPTSGKRIVDTMLVNKYKMSPTMSNCTISLSAKKEDNTDTTTGITASITATPRVRVI